MAPTVDELLAQAAASNGSPVATGSAAEDTLKVYLGSNPAPPRGPAMQADSLSAGPSDRGPAMHFDPELAPWQEFRQPHQPDRISEATAAANMIYSWSAKERKKWEQTLLDAGLIEPGKYNFADLVQMWQGAVEGAGQLYTHGGKKVTPQQYVKNFLGVNGIGGTGLGGDDTQTNTQKSVVHFDDLDAQGAAMDVYSSLLGRAADDGEQAALKAALNAYAKAHPSITTQTTTTDAQGNTSTTSKSRGGITQEGANELAMESVKAKPEYASYQAAATYYPLLEQALAGPGLDREF